MNTNSERALYVHVQLPGTLDTVPAALLKVERQHDGTYVGRFRYGDKYLERPGAMALDPFHLPLGREIHEFTRSKGIPGILRDAGPDAWGRRVIEHKLERAEADLDEIDYLLQGPQDGAGNLTFSNSVEPPSAKRNISRTHDLAKLIQAAEALEEGRRVPRVLLEQIDTSLGGARAKATIEDHDRLWLGKFPEKRDPFNVPRAEHATLALARRAGLNVCHARLERIAPFDVLLVERFDRERVAGGDRRLGFASAHTVLDCEDSVLERSRWSYPLLADEVRRWSSDPRADCAELFRRMVFNAAISNTDDHPSNHALIYTAGGWRLSPAFDLLPAPAVSRDRRDLAMIVGDYGRSASVYNLLSQCGRFGLTPEAARGEISAITRTVESWREQFTACGIGGADLTRLASAFLPPNFSRETPE